MAQQGVHPLSRSLLTSRDYCQKKMKNWFCHKSTSKRSQISDFNIKSLMFNIDSMWPKKDYLQNLFDTSSAESVSCSVQSSYFCIQGLFSAYKVFYILTSINSSPYLLIQTLAITNFCHFFIHTMLVYVFATLLMVPPLPRNLNQLLVNFIHPIKTKFIFISTEIHPRSSNQNKSSSLFLCSVVLTSSREHKLGFSVC